MDTVKLIINIMYMNMINLIITDINRIKLIISIIDKVMIKVIISIIDTDMIKLIIDSHTIKPIINAIDKDYDQTDKISMADMDVVKLITKSTESMGTWVVIKDIIYMVIIATWVVNGSGEITRLAVTTTKVKPKVKPNFEHAIY